MPSPPSPVRSVKTRVDTTRIAPAPVERIAKAILVVRGHKVILDVDLAALYEVETRVLNQAVKRNIERFPGDFLFQLSPRELEDWRSQLVISNPAARMGLRRAPFAFTEHGALMAATVLNSRRAVEMSLYVVRAFVQLRDTLSTNRELARKLDELARTVSSHDQAIAGILAAIRELTAPPATSHRPIGFVPPDEKKRG